MLRMPSKVESHPIAIALVTVLAVGDLPSSFPYPPTPQLPEIFAVILIPAPDQQFGLNPVPH